MKNDTPRIPKFKPYLFHPVLYKTVTRTSIVAVLMLLWERYVSDGTFTIWEAPGFLCGVVLLIWAWIDYMRLDGLTIHHLLEESASTIRPAAPQPADSFHNPDIPPHTWRQAHR